MGNYGSSWNWPRQQLQQHQRQVNVNNVNIISNVNINDSNINIVDNNANIVSINRKNAISRGLDIIM